MTVHSVGNVIIPTDLLKPPTSIVSGRRIDMSRNYSSINYRSTYLWWFWGWCLACFSHIVQRLASMDTLMLAAAGVWTGHPTLPRHGNGHQRWALAARSSRWIPVNALWKARMIGVVKWRSFDFSIFSGIKIGFYLASLFSKNPHIYIYVLYYVICTHISGRCHLTTWWNS